MKSCFGILLLSVLIQHVSYCQTVTLRTVSNDIPVESVHVFQNDTIVAVTGEDGLISLSGSPNDMISLSHVLYETISFPFPFNDTTIILKPINFYLPEAEFFAKSAKEFYKSKIKKGLTNGSCLTPVQIHWTDTLFVRQNPKMINESEGIASFFIGTKNPQIKIISSFTQNTEIAESKRNNPNKENVANDVKHIIGNAMRFSLALCGSLIEQEGIVEYIGKTQEYDAFKFYIFPQANHGETKEKGIAYINKEGILERIEAELTPTGQKYPISYQMTVDFHYFAKSNKILPAHILRNTFYFNKENGLYTCDVSSDIFISWDSMKN